MTDRELDALVAEKVMGWECTIKMNELGEEYTEWSNGKGGHLSDWGELRMTDVAPKYSTDIAAAWEVVEKLDLLVPTRFLVRDVDGWVVANYDEDLRREDGIVADTAPRAICLAALKVVGVDVG